jgi:hypothetical protein
MIGFFNADDAHARGEVNEACRRAQLDTFVVRSFASIPSNVDYCQQAEGDVPAVYLEILEWIAGENERIEKFFGEPISGLVPSGLNVVLEGSAFPGESYFAPRTVILGYLLDWEPEREGNPWEGQLDYLHEFAHLLQLDPLSRTPRALRAMARRNGFLESWADFVAFAISGRREDGFDLPELKGCTSWKRELSDDADFRHSFREFSFIAEWPDVLACCARLADAGEHTPRSKLACDEFQKYWDEEIKAVYPSEEELNARFAPRACLDAEGHYSNWKCDDHKIGVVINSFLFHLERVIGERVDPLYLDALADVSRPGSAYAQEFPRTFRKLRARLTHDQRAEFDLLWEIHDMDFAMELDEFQTEHPPKSRPSKTGR